MGFGKWLHLHVDLQWPYSMERDLELTVNVGWMVMKGTFRLQL